MSKNIPITRKEWEKVLETMTQYQRKDGYVDSVEKDNGSLELTFFDSDPEINGKKATFVTRDYVIKTIFSYPETSIPEDQFGVHQNHCCEQDGCKYGDADCPVVLKIVKQKYACEDCDCGFINS